MTRCVRQNVHRPGSTLFVSHTGAWGGGAEVVLLQLVRGARQAGLEVHAVCPRGPLAARLADEGCRTFTLAIPELVRTRNPLSILRLVALWLASAARLTLIIGQVRPLVVHANSGTAVLAVAVPAALMRRPLLWHQHDIIPMRRINRIVLGSAARLASTIVAVSRPVRLALIDLGADARKVIVIYNGVDCERFAALPTVDEARSALALPPGDAVLTVVGRLVPRKRQDLFLNAVALLRSQGLPVHAVLAGGTLPEPDVDTITHQRNIERIMALPELAGAVSVLGHVDDVRLVLAASDVVVMPSVNEPFPLAVLEASAAGIPVVATISGGHPEQIDAGRTGLLVPADNVEALAAALRMLVEDSCLRRSLGDGARARMIATLSEDKMQRQVLALYAATEGAA